MNKLSVGKWLFVISIYFVRYIIGGISVYQEEAERIREKSLQAFSGDITPHLGFFEVLKSAGFEYTPSWRLLVIVGSYLVIAAYATDYKSELNEGWKRVFIAAQVLFPILLSFIVWIFVISPNFNQNVAGAFAAFICFCIFYIGIGEALVLILIQCIRWIREGFTAKSKDNQ